MSPNWPRATFTDREQYHAQLAYEAGRGRPYGGWPFASAWNAPEPSLPPISVVD